MEGRDKAELFELTKLIYSVSVKLNEYMKMGRKKPMPFGRGWVILTHSKLDSSYYPMK